MLRRLLCCVLLVLPIFQLLAQSCSKPADSLADDAAPVTFWQQQLRFPRVRAAQAATGPAVATHFRTRYLDPKQLEIFLRLIKTNRELEVWARNRGGGPFELLHCYPLAATSGKLGPKRRAGDYQVPEGFYEIDRFNPKSNFHLSLGLNYPNAADQALSEANPGGNIFIHGGAATIGCMPITDAGIEEVYLLAVAARAAGQTVIPVHIFPFPLTQAELAKHAASLHQAFWRGLMPGYAYFERYHELEQCPSLSVVK
ncbi:L,D-transpeptidase family protein [Hymenobacter terrenus]|uniref:L,D-transpeptidase family protein n=1 Tax=Hymenobacter terrenus TaxID=1629124 RepID=UPI0006966712|nr:L,D-transpeptidase family protein [Hymenobacter terrenus]